MAVAEDSYDDLNELNSNVDELTDAFTKAANHLQTIVSSMEKSALLTLYGYYKQATEGPCNTPRPGWFDMTAKSKWDAWNKLGSMSKNEAKKRYIETMSSVDPKFVGSEETSSTKSGWVAVSKPMTNEVLEENSKTLVDFVVEGNVNKVESILKSKANDTINSLDNQGMGLIHWAADRGSVDMLRLLLSFGADVDLEDSEKQTALHYAASCGHYDCVDFLLKNGVNVHKEDADGLDALNVSNDEHIKQLIIDFNNKSIE